MKLANLANLQLARGAASAAQTSIRVALGAPRSRLIRQVLVESMILALAGGVLGLLVAAGTVRLLVRLAFRNAAYFPIDTIPSLPVFGFAFLLSAAAGCAFGLAGVVGIARGPGGGDRRRGPVHGREIDAGAADAGGAAGGAVAVTSIYAEIDRQLRRLPGVRNVALTLYSPMSGNNWQSGMTLEAYPQKHLSPSWDRVSGTFFDTVGAKILRGRTFDERDRPGAPQVAVINQAFAEQYFPNEDPIGKRFGIGGYEKRADCQIVGVVNTIRFRNPRAAGRPMAFLPIGQWKDKWDRSNLVGDIVLRVSGKQSGLAEGVHRTLAGIDPNLAMLKVQPVREHLGQMLSNEHLIGTLAQVFGTLALLLASIGLYGITAYSVARRTSEIGVRTALGATRGRVVRLILRGALAHALIGVAIGIPAALAAGRLLAGQVFGIKTSDPVTLAGAALTLGLCAAVAAAIPALRASGVDPVRALRVER